MSPLNRHGSVNALHYLLIRLKSALADFGSAIAAVFLALSDNGVAIAAAGRIRLYPAVVYRAAFRTFFVLEVQLRAADTASSLGIAFFHCTFSFRIADITQNIGSFLSKSHVCVESPAQNSLSPHRLHFSQSSERSARNSLNPFLQTSENLS